MRHVIFKPASGLSRIVAHATFALVACSWLTITLAQTTVPPPGTVFPPTNVQPLPPGGLAPGAMPAPVPFGPANAPSLPPGALFPQPLAAPAGYAPAFFSPASGGPRVPRYWAEPGKPLPYPSLAIQVMPARVVAPVGSEVVVMAGVTGRDGKYRAGERLEWVLETGGVGHFVALHRESAVHRLLKPDEYRKVDSHYALARTSYQNVALTRGTPTTDDDVLVQSGLAWISVTSALEGTSLVTAIGPEVYGWPERQQTATIHWIDAAFQLPPPAINPVGTRHTFTTVVARNSDHSPLVGWKVRYEIVDGPAAALGSGGPMQEIITNDLGQASVDISQPQAAPGTNRIRIDIIRPARAAAGSPGDLLVSSGGTLKTWTSPQIQVDIQGPPQVAVGARAGYQIEVNNRGDLPTRDVTVTLDAPAEVTLLDSGPPAEPASGRPTWRLGNLAAGERRLIQLNLQAQQPGNLNICATVNSGDGLTAQDCVTTTTLAQSVEVTVTGPDSASLGEIVPFQITVTNRGSVPVADLLVVNRHDPGLVHSVVTAGPIERDIGTLAAGESRSLPLELRVTQSGRLCHRVELLSRAGGGALATAEKCVEVAATATSALAVTKTGPQQADVGQFIDFAIDVRNTGQAPLTDIVVIDSYDASLLPVQATRGHVAGPQQVTWRVATLEPGGSFRLQIQCRCVERAARSSNRVTVRANPPVEQTAEATLEIRQPDVRLGVTVVDGADPIAPGTETEYIVRVKNNGSTPESNVTLVATMTPGLVAVPLGTLGPGVDMAVGGQGQSVRFAPVRELRSNEEIVYRIRARGTQPGQQRVQVAVTSGTVTLPTTATEETTVNP